VIDPVDPTEEFWNHMPPEVRRGLRELAFGQITLFSRIDLEKAPEHDPSYLGQALAIALVESHQRLNREDTGVRLSRVELLELGDWVRTTMDLCFRENIFRDLREHFDHSLALNSSEAVRERLTAHLSPKLKRNIEFMLAHIRNAAGWSPDSPQEMQSLGAFLRIAWEGNTMALLNYALDHQLIDESDLQALGNPFEEARPVYQNSLRAIRQDAMQLAAQSPEELIDRNRILRRILAEVRDAYGDAHPLARGFEGVFEHSLQDHQIEAADGVFELVEHFLTNRH